MSCALCGDDAPLQMSHVLPAFLFRWLRDSSGTGGHIRHGTNPNRRVQDGLKIPMLCAKCEAQFNTYETPFANNIFHPFDENDGLIAGYDDWMLKFCVSVSWRVLRHFRDDDHLNYLTSQQMAAVDRALAVWRDFLLGNIGHPGNHEQHILPMGPIESHSVPDMPTNMNRYLLRTIDMDIPSGDESVFTYAKLGPFMLFGYVHAPNHRWEGSKVHVRHGTISPRRYVLPTQMLRYLQERARKIAAIYDAISDTQMNKIDATAMKNIDRLVGSKQAAAIMADARLFGEEAVIRKSREKR